MRVADGDLYRDRGMRKGIIRLRDPNVLRDWELNSFVAPQLVMRCRL